MAIRHVQKAAFLLGTFSSAGLGAGSPDPPPLDILDCRWDSDWNEFRERLVENAQLGFPIDNGLALKAQEQLNLHKDAMEVDSTAPYGASLGMQTFFTSCNAPPGASGDPFCLYGAVAALWVVARHGHLDATNLMRHAEFLLGSTWRNALDFMESSGWPISSLDVRANFEEGKAFRLPQELRSYRTPQGGSAEGGILRDQVPRTFEHGVIRVTVWEIGVHASLSAEPLQMWARLLPRVELRHRNLIQDQYPQWLPKKCEALYSHPRIDCDTEEDDITELFRRRIPHSATSKDPISDIDGFAEEFTTLAGARLNSVDIFLCTVAYLCLLVGNLDLPVIGYFGHPLLFMVPDVQGIREGYWDRFTGMARSKNVGFAVSDPFLQMQYEYQVGAPRLPAIRTHSLYTRATHFPVRTDEVLVLDRPHESVLMCLIRRLMPGGEAQESHEEEWPLSEGRLRAATSPGYPYRFVTRAMTDKQFSTFAQFRAVVLWAYDMDLITFYEFYSMNMPIFMPSHMSKYLFQQDHIHYNHRWQRRQEEGKREQLWPEESPESPFDETSLDAVNLIVGYADYFRFPEVLYFESIPDLLQKLTTTNFFEVVQAMSRFNHDSLAETSTAWRSLLRKVTGWEAEFF